MILEDVLFRLYSSTCIIRIKLLYNLVAEILAVSCSIKCFSNTFIQIYNRQFTFVPAGSNRVKTRIQEVVQGRQNLTTETGYHAKLY
jgi:hypothetical protein